MTSRERVRAALTHREPDRVPIDLGSTQVTGIHATAYRNLCTHLGLDPEPLVYADELQGVALPSTELLDRLGVDTRGLFPRTYANWNVRGEPDGEDLVYTDDWGLTHRKRPGAPWWELDRAPLSGATFDWDAFAAHPWPNAGDPARWAGLREQALAFRAEGRAVVLKGLCAGLFEMGQRLRGMEDFLCDLLADPEAAAAVLDKVLELKLAFWGPALEALGDVVDVVMEADDYGTQESQLVGLETFRGLIAPRLRTLLGFLRERVVDGRDADTRAYILFHSCGNVRPFLPDFVDMGVDILNPVHIRAAGMEPEGLKRDFGDVVSFWGGGVDTQGVLPRGTPDEVRASARDNLTAFKPGGGYVFNTVHNIQPEVPPENLVALFDAAREYGAY